MGVGDEDQGGVGYCCYEEVYHLNMGLIWEDSYGHLDEAGSEQL